MSLMCSKLRPPILITFALWFLLLCPIHALPTLVRRQTVTGQSTTLMTVHTAQTDAGSMTETCIITLTPITDANGTPAVEEVRKCSLTMGDGSGVQVPVQDNSATPQSQSPGVNPSLAPQSQDAVAPPPNPNSSAPIPSPSPNPAAIPSPFPSLGSVAAPSPSPSTGSAAAAQSSGTPTAAFALPGKKLSVLPIGLGVFAGISVIALIVVGLVTYERTKYRKAFRQRKLAESGASMGYGGMAQPS